MSLPRLLLLSLSLVASTAAAEKPVPEYELTATGKIEIGPDGAVHHVELDDGLPKAVKQLIDANVATWKFEPVRVDGRAVIASTRLTLEIDAHPTGKDEYRLEVGAVRFGTPQSRGKITPPRYPQDAIRAGVGARVLLQAKLDAQGNVVAAHAYQTSLSKDGKPKLVERFRKRFEEVSLAAVKSWQYDVMELVDGEATGMTVMIPISFELTESPKRTAANQWQRYIPGPISPAPWVDAESIASADTDSLADGSAAALDSRFKLLSDVEGKAL